MNNKYKKSVTILLIVSSLLLLMIFLLTDPRQVGLLGVLAVVLAIYLLFSSCVYLLLSMFYKSKKNVNERRQVLISSSVAFAPILLIIFNSLGTIGVIEIISIVLFEIIAIFLITKRT